MVELTLGAILATVASVIMIAFKTVLDVLSHFGFVGYWIALMGIFYLDVNTNFLGQAISLITKPFIGFAITSFIMFCVTVVSGLAWFFYKSRQYLTGGTD